MKKFLCLMTLLGLAIAVNSQLTNNIVAYWKLDGNASDASGSNTGTVIGATADSQGKISSAYSFDGTDDYVSAPNSTSLNIQGNTISLSAWIKPSEIKTQMIVTKIKEVGTHTSPYFQYNLQLYGPSTNLYPRFCLSINGTIYYAAKSTLNLTLNQWYHVVGTYDGTNMRLYLNGSQVDTTSISGNITAYSTPVYLGVNGALGEAFKGAIDEVGIWNRTLTASEVTQLYNAGAGLTYPFGQAYALTTTATPSAGGTVSLSPAGGSYASGTTVTATATAASGYTFTGWSGSHTGTANPTTIVMDGNKSVTAIFTQDAPTPTSIWEQNGDNIYYNNSGNVGIGTSAPSTALTVNGEILAREVEVVSSIASDFVFEPDYELMPLTDLEIYLKQNKHLPKIPSAQDFAKTGQDLAKMQDLLLMKIEELTLYIIDLKRQLEEAKKQ